MLADAQKAPLCFHNLTNCFSRNRFALITMQIAQGCALPVSDRHRRITLNLFPFTLLRTLCAQPKFQLPCSQSLAHSFAKTPGVGVPRGATLSFRRPVRSQLGTMTRLFRRAAFSAIIA